MPISRQLKLVAAKMRVRAVRSREFLAQNVCQLRDDRRCECTGEKRDNFDTFHL